MGGGEKFYSPPQGLMPTNHDAAAAAFSFIFFAFLLPSPALRCALRLTLGFRTLVTPNRAGVIGGCVCASRLLESPALTSGWWNSHQGRSSLSLQEEEEEIARGTTGYWGCGRQYKVDLRVDLTEKVNRTKMEEEEKEVLGLDQI